MTPSGTTRTNRAMPPFPAFEVPGDYEAALFQQESNQDTQAQEELDASSAQPEPQDKEQLLEAQLDALLTLIGAQGILREVLYKTLAHCLEPRDAVELERFVAEQDEYRYQHVLQTPYAAIRMLVDAKGLAETPVDAAGHSIDPARRATLTEDELDDLTAHTLLATTEAGAAAVRLLDPARRIAAQLAKKPHRRATYCAVLAYCAEEPRTLPQIQELFKTNTDLVLDHVTAHHTLAPDYYVDRLEKAGALTWRGAWAITEAGRQALAAEPHSGPGSR